MQAYNLSKKIKYLQKMIVGKKIKKARKISPFLFENFKNYSTVTDLAKFLGWSTLHSLITAI